ncbi:MAG: metallophosphoesterase [Oscillatoriales cyanobacterium C42_A2020_001]|nr:metallophosphoesterase [Leptolyngbyaceae cyanobacterium C42_A2020_001]
MQFVVEPAIATKIEKMAERTRWRDQTILQRGIDQAKLVLDDGKPDTPDFSFLVIGDSGSGHHRGHNPQRQIAEQMLPHRQDCRFVLHTGDVIYLVGSREYYPKNFIEPYREFLVGGENSHRIPYDRMVFNLPFFLVPGNHDYYDLPLIYGLAVQAALPFRYLLRNQLDFDVGLHGSEQGNAYAAAFLDYLKCLSQPELEQHLDRHYTAQTSTGRCLRYQPGTFTRLPNRYYTFQTGGIDFFALDSNTFNAPIPLPETSEGDDFRVELKQQRAQLEKEQRDILLETATLNPAKPNDAERLDDLHAKREQLNEIIRDIDKQLASNEATTDVEQLEWLQNRLIESWQTEAVRGRVLFFHHPPYVTEATKWQQAQTMAVRWRLRQVLDAVAEKIGTLAQGRSIVDLVLNGHAHCLEYLRTGDTGHGDAFTNWIVCGGSGFSLRRQRLEGTELTEPHDNEERLVATSELFLGRSGQGLQKRRPYSGIRIDVKDSCPPKFVVRPFVAEWFQRKWETYEVEPFII